MRTIVILLVALILVAVLSACSSPTGGTSAGIPAFLEVGKTYEILTNVAFHAFVQDFKYKVLEIDKAGWIKVQHTKTQKTYWWNLTNVVSINEVP